MGQNGFWKNRLENRRVQNKRVENEKKISKGGIIVATMLSVLLLCACGKQEVNNSSISGGNSVVQETGAAQNSGNSVNNSDAQKGDTVEKHTDAVKNALAEAARLSGKELYQGIHRSCILQEDEKYLYVCGSHRVSRIDKATKTEEILWQNKKQVSKEQEYLYHYGSGVVLGDKIYFIERWYDAMQQEYRALSMVHTDGSGYERITELEWYCSEGMLVENGLLYIDGDDRELCYQVFEDGTLSKEPEYVEALNRDQIHYESNGGRVLFSHEKVTVSEEDVVFCSFNDNSLLFSTYNDGRRYILVDRESGIEYEIGMLDGNSAVIHMDNSYIYTIEILYGENGINYSYKRYNLETGEWQSLFSQEKTGFCKYVSRYLMDVVVKDEFIYYVEEMDGKYYLMRRNVNLPENAEKVFDAFYDNGIAAIGSVESDYQEIYYDDKAENLIFILSRSWIQVNDCFQGAEAINAYMKDYVDEQAEYAREAAEGMREWVQPGELGVPGEFNSAFSGFQYFDSRYISFYQAMYEYSSGAAHGMPYWQGMTFDLQTGKRLYLPDIIDNSEAELKEIVTAYFTEMINLAPDDYWTDALESVYEWTTLESDFYMTEEGFVFYFEPYALACYAAGFQSVTIPYEEFDMKISLEKAPKVPKGEGWGLSFGEEGVQPVGNYSAEVLAEYGGYFCGDASEKVIFLTFDCGYENGNTEALLDALKKHNAQATFFVVGHFLETAPELVNRMEEEGHTVGSHTYHHPDVTTLDKQSFQEEMDTLAVKYKEVTGEEIDMYYRPPEGKCSAKNMKWAKEMGYSTIFWSLAHVDWDTEDQPEPETAIEKLTARIHPGAVVLLHNTSATNAEILDELLTKWEEMGYEVRPLSDLLLSGK